MNGSCSRTNINDEEFLNAVLKNPILYDKKHENFRSINQKNNCWEQVAATLHILGE